jgi:hypothetical protein
VNSFTNLGSDRGMRSVVTVLTLKLTERLQNNPELGHLLQDPDVMRQTMEMMRNPAAFNVRENAIGVGLQVINKEIFRR